MTTAGSLDSPDSLDSVDLTDIALWMDDPYPVFRRLRESDPVHWHVAPPENLVYAHPFWALTRHADIVHVSRHPEIFSSAQGFNSENLKIGFTDYDTFAMLAADDPFHAWMRALVSKARVGGRLPQCEFPDV